MDWLKDIKISKEKGDCLSQNSSAGTPRGLYTQFTCVYIVFTVFFYTETLWPQNVKCKLIHTGNVNLYNQTFYKTFFKMCDICGGIKYEVYKNLGHL